MVNNRIDFEEVITKSVKLFQIKSEIKGIKLIQDISNLDLQESFFTDIKRV